MAVILASTWGLLRGSIAMSLDRVPEGIGPDHVQSALTALPGVTQPYPSGPHAANAGNNVRISTDCEATHSDQSAARRLWPTRHCNPVLRDGVNHDRTPICRSNLKI